jgi:hypothetical protein
VAWRVDLASLQEQACALAGRNFTDQERAL